MIDLLKEVPQVRKSKMRIHNVPYDARRQWSARSLGFDYIGAAVPVNDSNDQYSLARGVARRLLLVTPDVDTKLLHEFRSFVRHYLRFEARKYGLTPLQRVKSFDEWVDGINHPDWRKTELREARDRVIQGVPRRDRFVNKFHGKIEHLEGAKENRGINARCDEAKVVFGPLVSSIEDAVYGKIPEFAKHIPIRLLARKIDKECKAYGAERIIATDYTSFEGHFSPELIRACEGQLYRYMLSHSARDEAEEMIRVISGVNRCESRRLTFSVEGCRMSGDMMTSLGNGFTNLMIMKFLSRKLGFSFRGFVEGDDGIFLIRGAVPDKSWYARLGFTVKMDIHDEPFLASFCGQVYDPDTLELVVDPVYTCLTIGWTLSDQRHGGPAVMKSLLRSRALSLAYQAPRCPVVGALARLVLRLTSDVEARVETFHGMRDWWQNRLVGETTGLTDEFASRLRVGPSPGSRLVCETVFKMSVDDQISLERYFDGVTSLDSWSHPVIELAANPTYRRYYDLCVHDFPAGSAVGEITSAEYDWRDVVDVRGRFYRAERFTDFDVNSAKSILDPGGIRARWGQRG